MQIDIRTVRPCDSCGAKHRTGIFYVVATSLVIANAHAINATSGINIALGGRAMRIAEALSPDTEYLVVAGEKDPNLWTQLWLCQGCYLKPLNLPELSERENARAVNTSERLGVEG